jgi:drug/metabolite transporter (DMT)-like permease
MMARDTSSLWLRAMPAVFVLIWSTGFIVARYGMPYAPPMTFLAIRFALSIACFGLWALLAQVAWPSQRTQWLHLGVVGILVHAGYLGGVWSAIKLGMGSGLSSLLVGLQPVLTAIWLSSTGGRVTARQWGGLLLGFAGLVLVVFAKLGQGEATLLNLSWAMLALLAITTGTLYQKRFVTACDVRTASAVQLAAALMVVLPFALHEAELMQWNMQLAWSMAWSVLGLTLGGSSLLFLMVQRGAATAVTSLLYLVPPTTALMAWLLFNEAITLLTLMGTALTALGVWLVIRSAKAK